MCSYIVEKAAHFGHESLAIDRVALGRSSRLDNATWHTARVLTSGGRLLCARLCPRPGPALADGRRAPADAGPLG